MKKFHDHDQHQPMVIVQPVPIYEVRIRNRDDEVHSVGYHFCEATAQARASYIRGNETFQEHLEIVDAFVVQQHVR